MKEDSAFEFLNSELLRGQQPGKRGWELGTLAGKAKANTMKNKQREDDMKMDLPICQN